MRSVCIMLALAAVLAPRGYAMLKPSTANLDATLEKHHHEKPWFCHGLDCPEYTVVEKNDAYEVREYEEGVWATTSIETYNYALASSIGFKRLFNYIGGENRDSVEIPMTSPVLADVEPSCGPFCKQNFNISFFVPFAFQDSPPKPTSDDIEIICTPAFTAYVAQAGGFKLDEFSIAKMAGSLADALDADGVEYEDDHFYVAGYDPPFRFKDRHTEIWMKGIGSEDAEK